VGVRGAIVIGALCIVGPAACGGLAGNTAVVRVGDHPIRKATVDHWTGVIRRGGAFSGFRGSPSHGTPRQRAVAFLISSQWLIAEAARQGVTASAGTVNGALMEREREGAAFQKRLHATGQTIADVTLEMTAELAAEAIRQKLAERAAQITKAEVVDFYRSNRQRFHTLEQRIVDFVTGKSRPAVEARVGRVGTGARFARIASREDVTFAPDDAQRTPDDARLAHAIFAAPLGVASNPMKVNEQWVVFVVRKAIPPVPKPLKSVRVEVMTKLNVRRQHEIAARFDTEYRARWVTSTICSSGYVVPGCSRSSAPLGTYEDPFSSEAHTLLSERGVTG
jgi:hypothetical protein